MAVVSSSGSTPSIAAKTSAASRAERVIGPSLSIVQDKVIAPRRLTRPKVGRNEVRPQRDEGETIEPSVSLPIAKVSAPAATAEAAGHHDLAARISEVAEAR